MPVVGATITPTSGILDSLSDVDAVSLSVENPKAVQTTTESPYGNSSASSPIDAIVKNDPSALSTTFAQPSSTDDGPKTSSTVTLDPDGAFDTVSSTPQSSPWEASASTGSTAAGAVPTTNLSTNQTSGSLNNRSGEIWAGACIDTVPRAKALPGRSFYDFDGKTVKDPIDTLADAGVNAFRVQAFRGDCLGPEPFAATASPLDDEDDFKLDFGCIDVKVKIAKQAIALGMKMELTINQGLNIPKGTDGFLFHEEATGHNRGQNDGKVSEDVVNQERCGQIPTGKMDSYPQLAGYYKAEVIACNEAIEAAGFPTDTVRYGLHSHGQYVQWKESVVHGPKRASETSMRKVDGSPCEGASPIPANLLAMNASEVLTIAGFSAYTEPMRPIDINSASSLQATLSRLEETLTQIQGYSEEYGRYSSGPFEGQYKLQALGVEYATHFSYPDEIPQKQRHTEMMWDVVRKFSATMIGMLWWEPWYCNNHWEGGKATLCHLIPGPQGSGELGEAPTDTLKTWGAGARSPWKRADA
ncbi:MAG: hypothetical protein Q9199_000717 [Rusavskia elegans]